LLDPRFITFAAILILAVSLALAKGGSPERFGALIVVTMTVLQFGGALFVQRKYHSVDVVSVVVDALAVLTFGAIALHAKRAWPIWATSLQLLSLSSHFAREVDPRVPPMIYAVMKSSPTFLVLIVLLLGTLAHMRRVRINGSDPAWKEW
jgi:hypothetical protein